jgi:hypothetical protein
MSLADWLKLERERKREEDKRDLGEGGERRGSFNAQ